jgi:hypothetical protein
MKVVVIALCIASGEALADPVLMLHEAGDIERAQHRCNGATFGYEYLIKTNQCSQDEECQSAVHINAVCKNSGPDAALRAFHSKLLALFASNPHCAISIMRFTNGKSNAAVRNDLEAMEKANWQLNLNFAPGAAKQDWQLWPSQNGRIVPPPLAGEGDAEQIARDVCTIMTHGGAKILN